MTNSAVKPLVASTASLYPVVQVDAPVAGQAVTVVRSPAETYQRAIDAVVVSKKDVATYVAKAGPAAIGNKALVWASQHANLLAGTGTAGTFLGFLVGACAATGPGVISHTALLVAQGSFAAAAISLPTLVFAFFAGECANASQKRAQSRRLTTKDAASFLERMRSLDADERRALKPALSQMLAQLKGTLSAKAYGEAQALLDNTNEAASPVDERAAVVAQFIAVSSSGEDAPRDALVSAIDAAAPDERRTIAAVLEKSLFVNEQQRAPFRDPDGLYVIITKAAEGLSPSEKQS